MLVISRKAGEAVKIADNIEVRVLAVNGPKVKLGIQAPREVPVVRPESKVKA